MGGGWPPLRPWGWLLRGGQPPPMRWFGHPFLFFLKKKKNKGWLLGHGGGSTTPMA
jgi:hypothetical protein